MAAFIDFLPQCLKKGGAVPNYENFSSVVSKANSWLRDHPTALIKSCESILIKTQEKNKFGLPNGVFLSEAMAYNETFDEVSHGGPILVALRLWYIPQEVPKRKLPVPKPPQLKYQNLLPEQQPNAGILKPPIYESLFHIIEKYNQVRKEKPIEGTVLTIEVQRACYESENIDAEKTYLLPKSYMIDFVRVFYIAGEPKTEEIGCADFAPDKLTSSGYDRYQNVFRRASMWIRTQTGIRVSNVQSVNCRLKKDHEKEKCLDTQECVILWQQPGNTLRFVRVWYTRPADPDNVPPIAYLTYRTFHPAQKARKGVIEHKVECASDLMKRCSAWLNLTGANILNVETLHIHLFENIRSIESEENYVGRKSYSYKFAIGFRFIFNGPYEEPPPGFLPPLPELPPDDSECVVQ